MRAKMSSAQTARSLLDLTRQALELAQNSEWDNAKELEPKRQETARELFSRPVPEKDVAEVRKCVEQVFELNRELIQLGNKEKHAVASAMMKLKKGTAATKAYQGC